MPVAQRLAAQPAPPHEQRRQAKSRGALRITFPSARLLMEANRIRMPVIEHLAARLQRLGGSTAAPKMSTWSCSCEGKGMKEVMAMIVDAKSAGEAATFLVDAQRAPSRRRACARLLIRDARAPLGVGLAEGRRGTPAAPHATSAAAPSRRPGPSQAARRLLMEVIVPGHNKCGEATACIPGGRRPRAPSSGEESQRAIGC